MAVCQTAINGVKDLNYRQAKDLFDLGFTARVETIPLPEPEFDDIAGWEENLFTSAFGGDEYYYFTDPRGEEESWRGDSMMPDTVNDVLICKEDMGLDTNVVFDHLVKLCKS